MKRVMVLYSGGLDSRLTCRLLSEKDLKVSFPTLFRHKPVGQATRPLITPGRLFYDPQRQHWFVVGRNQSENTVIEQYHQVVLSDKGQPAV